MKALSLGPVLMLLGVTIFQAILVAPDFNLDAPAWLTMVGTGVAFGLAMVGGWMSARYHSWAPYIAVRRRQALRQNPQIFAAFLVAALYFGYLSLGGDRLGFSIRHAGSVGLFLMMIALLAGECWAWAVQSGHQASQSANG